MSMRRRLTIAMSLLLIVTLVALSVVLVRTTRSSIVDQLDVQLVDFTARVADGGKPGGDYDGYGERGPGGPPDGSEVTSQESDATDPVLSRFFKIVIDPTGTEVSRDLSGYESEPDAPPRLPDLASPDFADWLRSGDVRTVEAEDGSLRYRAMAALALDGDTIITAIPMAEADQAVEQLVRAAAIVGAIALVTAIGVSSLLVRRSLRPVDTMVETAQAIASGNLSLRVPNPDPATELGRLGAALNHMLGQIEEADVERAAGQTRLRRFVADAAHELRTPLTSLRGYAELYRSGALPDAPAIDRAMQRIESEGARMARLVDDLLLLARMDQQRPLERLPVDLAILAQDAIDDFRVVEPDRIIGDELEPGATVPGDELRLRQVIDNLLSNVRTHTPAGTGARISVRSVDDRVHVQIADDGPGISPEDQERVFERFWRADPARTRGNGGAGLGLAIVQSLVAAHGGEIEVVSEAGVGTTFTVSLPRVTDADTDIEPAAD